MCSSLYHEQRGAPAQTSGRSAWSLSSASSSQEGHSNIWQQDTAKACFKNTHNKYFFPSSLLPALLGILFHPALLNQGFGFSFAGKMSSALFFPKHAIQLPFCYPYTVLFSQSQHLYNYTTPWVRKDSRGPSTQIGGDTLLKEVSPPFYRCVCEAQSTLRHSHARSFLQFHQLSSICWNGLPKRN